MASSHDTSSSSAGNIETSRGAMPAFQARALQKLHWMLVKELDIQQLKDHSFSNGLIDHDLMVELSGMTRREGTRAFLENLQQSGTNGYQKFLEVLQVTGYFGLKHKIEETLSKQFPTNINIVLIGKTGVGKSRLGNSLLNQPAAFVSRQSMDSVTKVCSLQSCKIFHHGKEVTVNIIDSPGLADSNTSTNDIIREITKCMELAKGRVDIFIVVINAVERMTDEGKAPIHMLKDRYGVESEAFVLIVFTHTDQISDETNLEDLIKENTFLRETISLFKNRYCSFGINSVDHDVKEIFNHIFAMIEENYDTYYSHCLFEAAAKNFDEQIATEKKRLEEEKKREMDELTKKIEDRVRMEFEERYRKIPVASQSLKEEQRREVEEIKQKVRDELTKEIEDKLRMEYDKRYRKIPVGKDLLSTELDIPLASQSLEEEQKREVDELTKERYRRKPVASQSLKEEQKREEEEQKSEVDELTQKNGDRLGRKNEKRYTYRKKTVGKASVSLGMLERNILKPVLKIHDKKNKEEKSFGSSLQRDVDSSSPDELYHVAPGYLYQSDSRARVTDKLFKTEAWNGSASSLYPSDPKVTTTESDRTFRSGTGTGVNSQSEQSMQRAKVTPEQFKERAMKNTQYPTDSKVRKTDSMHESHSPDEKGRTSNICTECGQRWNGRGRWLGV